MMSVGQNAERVTWVTMKGLFVWFRLAEELDDWSIQEWAGRECPGVTAAIIAIVGLVLKLRLT
jgi:hypothetical protein